MINVQQTIEGDDLVLRINLKERHGPSKSGKTTIVGSSEGNQIISYDGAPETEELFLGLNCYSKKLKKSK